MDPDSVRNLCCAAGMSYNLADEPKIMANILNMSIREMSKYADVVIKLNYNNNAFLEDQIPSTYMQKYETIYGDNVFNPTSIGNAAYLATYSPEPYASRSRYILNTILDAYARK